MARKTQIPSEVDVVAFGAHPDDVDLGVGGTLLHLHALGYTTAIVDMTRGELSSRGDLPTRAREALASAAVLKVSGRYCLELSDGHLSTSGSQAIEAVVDILRTLRPTIILAPTTEDLHPDHAATGRIVREASFFSGVLKWKQGRLPHRARTVLGYYSHFVGDPDLVIDITPHFAAKKKACLEFRSQFFHPKARGPKTYISRPEFWDWWEARARQFGHRTGVQFGEGFQHEGPIAVRDPVQLFDDYGYYPRTGPKRSKRR